MNEETVLIESQLPLPLFIRGKVRDTYDLGEHLLIVASDRISAFDFVLPCGIPDKGRVLNQLSVFWFRQTENLIPNHMVEPLDNVQNLDRYLPSSQRFDYPPYLAGRSMVVKKVDRIMVECVVRGYLSGSAWAEYREHGTVSGEQMPPSLRESEELPEVIFTPTTKIEAHDRPISREEMEGMVGKETAATLREMTLKIYDFGRKYAESRGIILADTKMEFGWDGDEIILIDELLTPDSSRFWDTALYQVGQAQPSYDKQPIRDWLTQSGWNKQPPAPPLPPEVIEASRQRYRTAYERLAGQPLP